MHTIGQLWIFFYCSKFAISSKSKSPLKYDFVIAEMKDFWKEALYKKILHPIQMSSESKITRERASSDERDARMTVSGKLDIWALPARAKSFLQKK